MKSLLCSIPAQSAMHYIQASCSEIHYFGMFSRTLLLALVFLHQSVSLCYISILMYTGCLTYARYLFLFLKPVPRSVFFKWLLFSCLGLCCNPLPLFFSSLACYPLYCVLHLHFSDPCSHTVLTFIYASFLIKKKSRNKAR